MSPRLCAFALVILPLVACGGSHDHPSDGSDAGVDAPIAPVGPTGPAGAACASAFALDTSLTLTVGHPPVAMVDAFLGTSGPRDLITASSDGTLSVLLNNPTVVGGFQAPQDYPIGSGAIAITTGDFNRDGAIDVAVLERGAVDVLLGVGNGMLRARTTFATADKPVAFRSLDANGDGIADLVVGNADSFSVLLGHGDGTFADHVDTQLFGGVAQLVLAGDLDGDGQQDLAIVNGFATDEVQVLRGDGKGSFSLGSTTSVGFPIATLAVNDLTNDQIADLVVTAVDDPLFHEVRAGKLAVLAGNGDGTFQPAVDHAIGDGSLALASANLDLDGRFDVASLDHLTGTVSVLRTNGAARGVLGTLDLYPVDANAATMWLADFNADQLADVAIAQPTTNSVRILYSDADQSTLKAPLTAFDFVRLVRIGDLDGDGKPDAVSFEDDATTSDTTLVVQRNLGAGLTGTPTKIALGFRAVEATIADVDRDGHGDILVSGPSGTLQIAFGHADGSFTLGAAFAFGHNPNLGTAPVYAVDLDHDGKLDLIAIDSTTTAAIARGNGDGTFAPARSITTVATAPANESNHFLAVGDLDGDGNADLVVVTDQSVNVLRGAGDGTFAPPSAQTVVSDPHQIRSTRSCSPT
jgi:hypothetical protein